MPEGHTLDIPRAWAGFKIPYFTPQGKVNGFYRFRYLQYQPSKGFGSITAPLEKPQRYAQPKGSKPHIYLPPLFGGAKTWAGIMEDVKDPVCITEGELKAACAVANGIMPTIGLGGVYNWKSMRLGLPLIPELEAFTWQDRNVYLCFDSDTATNPMVATAASQLARKLTDRGAVMFQVELPNVGAKQGLDDYAYAYGMEALSKLFMQAKPVVGSAVLHSMNLEFGVLNNERGEVVRLEDGQVYPARSFTETVYKNRTYDDKREGPKGISLTVKYTAKEWIAWPQRLTLRGLIYSPGETSRITDEGYYNTWLGWGVEPSPKPQSVTPWLELLGVLMNNAKPEHIEWLRQWFAWPLVHPGAKLYTAVIMWGRQQGTGKTLLGDTMRRIYGRNFRTVTTTDLASQFNEWAGGHQFIAGDEISTGNKRNFTDSLKDIITREEVIINRKYQSQYRIRDCNNYYFTSNHPDAFFIEDADRRYFVHETAETPAPTGFYERYIKWLDHEGGASALFHYFLHEVDLAKFSPKERAPLTDAKQEMIRDSKSDVANWALRLRESPDDVLRTPGSKILPYALYTIQELLRIYDPPPGHGKVTVVGLCKELKGQGFKRVANASNNCIVDGVRVYLWAVRDVERLSRLGPAAASKMYAEERIGHVPKFEGGARKGRAVQ